MRSISSHLLSVAPLAQEYSYCQYHSLRSASPEETLHNAIGINECVRNFRFMIVEATQVSQKDIKLEKTYHTNFISPGWHCEPGQLTPQHLPPIAHLQLLMNGHRLPVYAPTHLE